MGTSTDYRTRDLGQTRLRLRHDLVITPRLDGDHPGYLIEDPVSSRFFRIGLPEHAFISLLDGATSVQNALSITAQIEPEHAFTMQQAATICRWLIDNQLASTDESTRTGRLIAAANEHNDKSWTQWNPWFLRIPLWHPDQFFSRCAPLVGWLFSWPAVLLSLCLAGAASNQVFIQWDRFIVSARGILATDRWIWVGLCWLIIKVLHESAHAIACRRYGGEAREAGVMLVLAAPLAYVDVSSSWRFRSKWQRINTALAGIYVELIIASLATLAWSIAGSGRVADLCIQVALMTSVTTVLFNANPLMRFDGYYVVSDLLELPNLYSHGQQIMRYWGRRSLWGVTGSLPQLGRARMAIATAYGAGSAIWRTLVCIGLTVTATHMLHGAGVVLAAAGLACWIAPPVVAQVKFFLQGDPWNRPRRLRFLFAMTLLCALSVLAAYQLPWPGEYRAPCLVDYSPPAVVRVASPGFVRRVLVQPGQTVQQDEPLIELANDSLRLDLTKLQLDLEQSDALMRTALYDDQLTDYQVQQKKHTSLKATLLEKQAEVDTLTICAPIAGSVVAHDLQSLVGQYLHRGSELLTIGNEDYKELRISVDQNDVDAFAAGVGEFVRVRLHGAPRFAARLAEIDPQAYTDLPDRAFSAELGGPLAVRPVDESRDAAETVTHYELPTPRFNGTALLSKTESRVFHAGQRGVVSLGHVNRSIAQHLELRARQWLDQVWQTPR